MLKGWLDRCTSEHGPGCKETGLDMPNHPNSEHQQFLVIDVVQSCVVQLPLGSKYVALSYVWGPDNWPRSMRSNMSRFMQQGAFPKSSLPAIISDAIEVTRFLGYDYLWVDSVCIIQDDSMKSRFIASMDGVYGNADVTIVAASGGSAHAGLSGWSGFFQLA